MQDFCEAIALTAERYGTDKIGIGSDLRQDQPDSIVEWMRVGCRSKEIDYGEGSAAASGFPPQPDWFRDNRDFGNIEDGPKATGVDASEVAAIMEGNWYRFYADNFTPRP